MLVRDDVALWAQASATVHRKTWYLKADVKLVGAWFTVYYSKKIDYMSYTPLTCDLSLGLKTFFFNFILDILV